MTKNGPPEFTIEGASIIFRNFSGREDTFNKEGDRNFSLVLDDDIANDLRKQGWNIKQKENQETGELYPPTLEISVAFNKYPPSVWLLRQTSEGIKRVLLSQENVGNLDTIEIENIDLTVRGYRWQVNDKTGIKAYAKEIFVTAYQTPLDSKYEGIPIG